MAYNLSKIFFYGKGKGLIMRKKFLQDWQILRSGKRSDFAIIIAITLIFLFVITINVRLIYRMTAYQAEEMGQTQLEVIRGDFQSVLYQAEGATLQMSMEAEQMLSAKVSLEDLEKYFYRRKREQKNMTGGVCFNAYIAGKDWTIIPDFDMPPDYHAPERLWYKGAAENPGKVYFTEPYVDAMTGTMCYTISKMLDDNQTVVAMDFTFADVQYFIRKMSANKDRKALIVTDGGMIIGYNDMNLVGQKVSDKLPEYEGILARILQADSRESFTATIDGEDHTIFSSKTPNGWYIILSIDNRAFYRDSHRQMFFTTILSLIMMLAIIFFYLNAMRNGLRAENALHVKEEFLSRLSKKLRDPLKNILKLSNVEGFQTDGNPAENAAKVRESALKLSDMLDDLFSYSTIISSDKKKSSAEKTVQGKELSKISRYARGGIIAVLTVAMVVAFVICLRTTLSDGDTKMNRAVDTYEHQLSNWIEKQRSILLMLANILSEHPELMNDYPSAVKFLDGIAKHYPEMSVCYLANPYNQHQVIMNNGWESSDPEWRVDKRPWYIDAEKSVSGFSVSAPYLDAQTGMYCVTMAKIVFGRKGEFVGIFAIDFYLDRLTQVLGESYTKDGYAFLVDRNGIIINHPNNEYQMSKKRMTDISGTEYANNFESNDIRTFRDYSGKYVSCLAKKNVTSQFTVIVANSWWNIYGNIFILGIVFIALLSICIVIVNTLISRLLSWQASVNRQLQEASDTALAASQAKSQFLAQMSHEIRTPINAVLGMNEMILREGRNPDVIEYAHNIQSAGKTLLTLINSILDFSKIEDGKMEIIPVRYETLRLIDDLVHMISEKARKKGLEFKTDIDSGLPQSLYGDDVRLRQIVTNILTNAVKYTHTGSVTLHMGGKAVDADTFALQVKVSDTGIGIRKEDMGKLFQSFQRLDEEKNRNIEGTGLGIAIVQKLLGMMDSRLEVASEYGKGSEFSFNLIQRIIDRHPVGEYDERHLKPVDNGSEKKFLVAAGAKVLAVDDNDMNLKVVTALLKRNKIVPELADSGRQCIEMAKKNFYHIIFLDNMMPGMNGLETLKVMRRENILSDKTAVVMLTASAIAGMRELYLREGFDDYLSKPIDIAELEAILAKYLPAEIVSFASDEKEDIPAPTAQIEQPPEDNEPVGEDEFGKRARQDFAAACPDIDLDTGLKYCMDSKSFFVEMLTTFADAARADKIQAAFDAGDWKNYQILVHALKSTSLSIGAAALSDKAKALELAAKDADFDFIRANHADLMTAYQKVREEIAKWLGLETEPPEDEPVGEDEFGKRDRQDFAAACPNIDLDTGLKYCMDSKSFFVEMLTTFADAARADKLQAAFDAGDWKNYQILVHALKSTSLSIGATALSERAKNLELAAKDADFDFIRANHADLMTVYKKVREEIKQYLEAG